MRGKVLFRYGVLIFTLLILATSALATTKSVTNIIPFSTLTWDPDFGDRTCLLKPVDPPGSPSMQAAYVWGTDLYFRNNQDCTVAAYQPSSNIAGIFYSGGDNQRSWSTQSTGAQNIMGNTVIPAMSGLLFADVTDESPVVRFMGATPRKWWQETNTYRLQKAKVCLQQATLVFDKLSTSPIADHGGIPLFVIDGGGQSQCTNNLFIQSPDNTGRPSIQGSQRNFEGWLLAPSWQNTYELPVFCERVDLRISDVENSDWNHVLAAGATPFTWQLSNQNAVATDYNNCGPGQNDGFQFTTQFEPSTGELTSYTMHVEDECSGAAGGMTYEVFCVNPRDKHFSQEACENYAQDNPGWIWCDGDCRDMNADPDYCALGNVGQSDQFVSPNCGSYWDCAAGRSCTGGTCTGTPLSCGDFTCTTGAPLFEDDINCPHDCKLIFDPDTSNHRADQNNLPGAIEFIYRFETPGIPSSCDITAIYQQATLNDRSNNCDSNLKAANGDTCMPKVSGHAATTHAWRVLLHPGAYDIVTTCRPSCGDNSCDVSLPGDPERNEENLAACPLDCGCIPPLIEVGNVCVNQCQDSSDVNGLLRGCVGSAINSNPYPSVATPDYCTQPGTSCVQCSGAARILPTSPADNVTRVCTWPCGDGIRQVGEFCDPGPSPPGTADVQGFTCVDVGFWGGTLSCNPTCTAYDTSNCF